MAGKRGGLQALVKRVSPNVQWTHCMIHREALASKQVSPELKDVMTDIIATVNYIKTRPVKALIFCALCEEMASDHTAILFHSESRWLSHGKVFFPGCLNCGMKSESSWKKMEMNLPISSTITTFS